MEGLGLLGPMFENLGRETGVWTSDATDEAESDAVEVGEKGLSCKAESNDEENDRVGFGLLAAGAGV